HERLFAPMNTPSIDVYRELRSMAKVLMRGERRGHTLTPTDLFHEAYSRLNPFLSTSEKDIEEFLGLFAVTMRRVLVEHARKRARRTRRLHSMAIIADRFSTVLESQPWNRQADRLLDLDLALQRLAAIYPLHAKVVELKYFGRLSVHQCADHLDIGPATVQRYWQFARAWIGREMQKIDEGRK
ncbi:MAG: ECF-type sigma factor, partial [Pirellulaceae bacterium]